MNRARHASGRMTIEFAMVLSAAYSCAYRIEALPDDSRNL